MNDPRDEQTPEEESLSDFPVVDRESTRMRLLPDFPTTTWMLPYIGRSQEFRVRNFLGDRTRLLKSFQEMSAILEAKGVGCLRARKISYRALDVACHHQAEQFRLAQEAAEFRRAHERREELVGYIAQLKELLFGQPRTPLPSQAIGNLNEATRNRDWTAFDTEFLCDLLGALLGALKEELPQETAIAAWTIISGSPPTDLKESPNAPDQLRQLALAGPVMGLWEILASDTRAPTEEEIRRLWKRGKPPLRKPLATFLEKLLKLLRAADPKIHHGRPYALHRRYLRTITRLCEGAGLKPGLAKRDEGPQPKSPFQRFARAALAAVGPDIPISQLQVRRIKQSAVTRPIV